MQDRLYSFYENELKNTKKNNLFRHFKTIQEKNNKYIVYNNKKYINLSSNDYLALGTDDQLHKEFYDNIDNANLLDSFGLGSTSSRLLTGDYSLYIELEYEISCLYNKYLNNNTQENITAKDVLVFNSGYHANIGIISCLMRKGDLILSDELNHASIIDGIRLSRAEYIVFEHLNYDHLKSILELKRDEYNNVLIISESLFSMDGDIADIDRLVELKKKYNTMLYLDEAHAFGIFGETGLGICERSNTIKDIDIILGTFGKAIASLGAFAVLCPVLKEYLINNMRTLLYTTALPPVIINWNLFIIKKFALLSERRKIVLNTGEMLRQSLSERNIKTAGESQIVPAIIGENKKTVNICNELQSKGFLLFPIRPPTVPPGTSRIRISLTSEIDWDEIKIIPEIISNSAS